MRKTQEDRHYFFSVESSRAFIPPWSYSIINDLSNLLLSDQHLLALLQIGTLEAISNSLYLLTYLVNAQKKVYFVTSNTDLHYQNKNITMAIAKLAALNDTATHKGIAMKETFCNYIQWHDWLL